VSRVAALVLAVVFAWSGIAKLVRRPDMTPLGLPAWAPVAIGVVEVGLAVALVLAPANAGLAALVVLAGFTAFLVPKVGSGEGCGCFGASTKPVSTRDLLRNGVLLVVAAIAAFA
jgi:hypothetical protein